MITMIYTFCCKDSHFSVIIQIFYKLFHNGNKSPSFLPPHKPILYKPPASRDLIR